MSNIFRDSSIFYQNSETQRIFANKETAKKPVCKVTLSLIIFNSHFDYYSTPFF